MRSVYKVVDGGDDFWYVCESAELAKQLHINTQYESAEIHLDDEDKTQMKVSRMLPHHYLTLDGKCQPASQWAQENSGFIGTTAT